MKQLHRENLYGWSQFNEERNIDFHSTLWVRANGNLLIDPLHLSNHDLSHLSELGGARWIVITNSDHIRDAQNIASRTGASIFAPHREQNKLPIDCERWLVEGDDVIEGVRIFELEGSKTAGELALLLDGETLVCGDLIRAHMGGRLCLLPDAKLSDKAKAIESVKRMASIATIESVLLGDGWPIFHHGQAALSDLVKSLSA